MSVACSTLVCWATTRRRHLADAEQAREVFRVDGHLVDEILLVVDLAGTFVFALSGAMAGVKHRLDLFQGLFIR